MAKKPKAPKQPPAARAPEPTLLDRFEESVKKIAATTPPGERMPDVSEHLALLGKQARDRVTGLAGTITSVSFDLFGCAQAVICPPLDKEGKMQDGRWLDVNRIEITNHTRTMPVPPFAAKPAEHDHGPADKPARGY